jgi:hypothetical protein
VGWWGELTIARVAGARVTTTAAVVIATAPSWPFRRRWRWMPPRWWTSAGAARRKRAAPPHAHDLVGASKAASACVRDGGDPGDGAVGAGALARASALDPARPDRVRSRISSSPTSFTGVLAGGFTKAGAGAGG